MSDIIILYGEHFKKIKINMTSHIQILYCQLLKFYIHDCLQTEIENESEGEIFKFEEFYICYTDGEKNQELNDFLRKHLTNSND